MTYTTSLQRAKFIFLSLFLFILTACSKDEIKEPDTTEIPGDTETQIKDFVWRAMHSWYLYEAEVPKLADQRKNDRSAYIKYLESFSGPEALFEDLLYKEGTKDRFSFIVDDYDELEKMLKGISESFGYDCQLVGAVASVDELMCHV